MALKKCDHCSQLISVQATFCPHCGKVQKKSAYPGKRTENNRGSQKSIIIILIAVICILAGVIAGLIYFFNQPEKAETKSDKQSYTTATHTNGIDEPEETPEEILDEPKSNDQTLKIIYDGYGYDNLAPQAGNTYIPKNMLDNNPATAWAINLNEYINDPSVTYIIGPSFRLQTPSKISEIKIINGYAKDQKSWINNTRTAWIRIFRCHSEYEVELTEEICDDDTNTADILYEGPLKDIMQTQTLKVSNAFNNNIPTRRIAIKFKNPSDPRGYYKGNKWNDLCISEFRIIGSPF